MTHTGPVSGDYEKDWQKTNSAQTNPGFKCRKCGSHDISFREWESSCGGYEDIHYRCDACKHDWWVEGADS